MRIVLYGNGTCGNHGCEAIARGTISLLGANANTYRIQSENPAEDRKYGLEELAQISPAKSERKKDFRVRQVEVGKRLCGHGRSILFAW